MEEKDKNIDKVYNNLILLLKMFKNKPYQLGKYLMQNDALNEIFLEKLLHSKKLNELDEKIRNGNNPFPEEQKHFNNIYELKKSQSDILRPEVKMLENKDIKQLEQNLNKQLREAEEKEDFEKAATIRDYMLMLNITPQPKN